MSAMPRPLDFALDPALDLAPRRRFAVHAAEGGRHEWEMIMAESHDAAAVGYLEQHGPALGEDGAVRVIVTDCGSGEEHCFHLDVGDGAEPTPCD